MALTAVTGGRRSFFAKRGPTRPRSRRSGQLHLRASTELQCLLGAPSRQLAWRSTSITSAVRRRSSSPVRHEPCAWNRLSRRSSVSDCWMACLATVCWGAPGTGVGESRRRAVPAGRLLDRLRGLLEFWPPPVQHPPLVLLAAERTQFVRHRSGGLRPPARFAASEPGPSGGPASFLGGIASENGLRPSSWRPQAHSSAST